jgi:dihydroorotase
MPQPWQQDRQDTPVLDPLFLQTQLSAIPLLPVCGAATTANNTVMNILLRNALILDPRSPFHGERRDIRVSDGVITAIAADLPLQNEDVVEAAGLTACPGWVDPFAGYGEPGFEQKETIATGLAAAAAGGFTDVLLTPDTKPFVSDRSVIALIKEKAAGNIVSLHPLGAASRQGEGKDLAEMLDMHHSGARAFTDGRLPVQSSGLALKVLEYVRAFDGIFIEVPSDVAIAKGGLMHEGVVSMALGMPGIPDVAETLLLHRDIELLRYTGSKLHITGLSCRRSVDMVRAAKAEGLNITCSVTPYHLAYTDESLRSYSSIYKVSPPLRTEDDRQALIDGLADGTIDCIASHHHPQDHDAKAREFEYAGEGMAVQEAAFPLMLKGTEGRLSNERLIDALSVRTRAIFGLDTALLALGAKACITLFSTTESTDFPRRGGLSMGCNSPVAGQTLPGRVVGIINNGQVFINSK